jgi:hypothetical protein
MDENTHTIKRNTEALVVTSKEAGLVVNTEKTKYMVMHGNVQISRTDTNKSKMYAQRN